MPTPTKKRRRRQAAPLAIVMPRTLRILAVLLQGEWLTLAEICARTGSHPKTARRTLLEIDRAGFALRAEEGYRGIKSWRVFLVRPNGGQA